MNVKRAKSGRIISIDGVPICDRELFGADNENTHYIFYPENVRKLGLVAVPDGRECPSTERIGFTYQGYDTCDWRRPGCASEPLEYGIYKMPIMYGVSLTGQCPDFLFVSENDCREAYKQGGHFLDALHLPVEGELPVKGFISKIGYVKGEEFFRLANGLKVECYPA